ncbi:MAG: BspA family leucine-rich repeat surface protein [Clostridiales bacterium]|nr:BspA family leucine-rich repeat surface protein [Clostridiales bacterium]
MKNFKTKNIFLTTIKNVIIGFMLLIACFCGGIVYNKTIQNRKNTMQNVMAAEALPGYLHKDWFTKLQTAASEKGVTITKDLPTSIYFTSIDPEYNTSSENIVGVSIGSILETDGTTETCGEKDYTSDYSSTTSDVICYLDTASYEIVIFCPGTIFAPTDSSGLFESFTNLTTIEFNSVLDTSKVRFMGLGDDESETGFSYGMFRFSTSLKSLDLSGFDTANVTNMSHMFDHCTSLETITFGSDFNVSNVTNMSHMFYYCTSLETITFGSDFNVSNVTNMSHMFDHCTSLLELDLTGFQTSSLKNLNAMFANCISLETVTFGSNFYTGIVKSTNYMFSDCKALKSLDLSMFSLSSLTNMDYMFYSCTSLESLNFHVNIGQNQISAFFPFGGGINNLKEFIVPYRYCRAGSGGAPSLTFDLPSSGSWYDVDSSNLSVTTREAITTIKPDEYSYYIGLEAPTIYENRVAVGYNITPNLNGGTVKGNMPIQYYYSKEDIVTTLPIVEYDDAYSARYVVTSNNASITDNYVLTIPAGTASEITLDIITEEKENTSYLHKDWATKLGITRSEITKITFTNKTEDIPSGITGVSISSSYANEVCGVTAYDGYTYDVIGYVNGTEITIFSKAEKIYAPTDSTSLFASFSKLTTLDFNNMLDTSLVTNMNKMFNNCSALTSIDVSCFDTSNVTIMSGVFFLCSSLISLDLSSWDVSSVTMFSGGGNNPPFMMGSNALKEIYAPYNIPDGLGVTIQGVGGNTWYEATGINSTTTLGTAVTDITNANCSTSTSVKRYAVAYSITNSTDSSVRYYFYSGEKDFEVQLPYSTDETNTTVYTITTAPSIGNAEVTNFNKLLISKNTYGNIVLSSSDIIAEQAGYLHKDWATKFGISKSKITKFTFTDVAPAVFDSRASIGSIPTTTTAEDGSIVTTCGTADYDNLSCYDVIGYLNGTEFIIYCPYKIYAPTDCSNLFSQTYATQIEFNDLFDTSKVTNMYQMFGNLNVISKFTSLDLSGFDTSNVTNMAEMFYFCYYLENITFGENFDTSSVITINKMFSYCRALKNLDLSGFNTNSVTDIDGMFSYCQSLATLDLSSFNTSKITKMTSLFQYCSSLESITFGENFDTSNVKGMGYHSDWTPEGMFYNCSSLTELDLSHFNTSNVTNMAHMFDTCSSLKSIIFGENFVTTNVTDVTNMFLYCKELTTLDLSGFDLGGVGTSSSNMLFGCTNLKEFYAPYNVKETLSMSYAGNGNWYYYIGNDYTSILNLVVKQIDANTCSTSTSAKRFTSAYSITNETTGEVVYYLFNSSKEIKVNLPGLTAYKISSSPTGGSAEIENLTTLVLSPNTYGDIVIYSTETEVEQAGYLHRDWATKLGITKPEITKITFTNQKPSTYNTKASVGSCVVSKTYPDGRPYTTWGHDDYDGMSCYDVTGYVINTEIVIYCPYKIHAPRSCMYLFGESDSKLSGFTSLTTIEFNDCFDISKTHDLQRMFDGCSSLKSLDLSSFGENQAFNMDGMFEGCSSLESINLNNLDTSSVTLMRYMFKDCDNLKNIIFGENFDTSNVTDMQLMFYNCPKLTNISFGEKFNTSAVTNMCAMFYGCESLTDISFVNNFDTSSVTDMRSMFAGCNGLENIDLINFDTSNVEEMTYMFAYCENLKSITFGEKFNSNKVLSISQMFDECVSLTSVTFSENFKAKSVTDASDMFNNCKSLIELDLSMFETESLIDMDYMFDHCFNLKVLDISNFITSNVTSMSATFQYCFSIVSLDFSNFDLSKCNDLDSNFPHLPRLKEFYAPYKIKDEINLERFSDWYKEVDGYISTADKVTAITSENCSTQDYAQRYLAGLPVVYKDKGGLDFTGTFDIENFVQVQLYNKEITLKEPTKEKYIFEGWYLDSECTNKVTTLPGLTTDNFESTTLYANYIRNSYTVTWKNLDGKVLEIDENVEYLEMPTFDSNNPTMASDAKYSYVFNGWTPEIVPVTNDVVYTAKYLKTLRTYTVFFYMAESSEFDGVPTWPHGYITFRSLTVFYGTKIYIEDDVLLVDADTPVSVTINLPEDNAQYIYTFDYWTVSDGYTIVGDIEIFGVYTKEVNTYSINFEVNNSEYGTVSQSILENVPYGTTLTVNENEVVVNLDTPVTITANVVEADGFITTFVGFDIESTVTLTSNMLVKANFDRIKEGFILTLEKGTGIKEVTGAGTYAYNAEVVIEAKVLEGYTWYGWSGDITESNKTYTFTMPANNVTLTAIATANTDTQYTVIHYQENLSGNYEVKETEILTGTTDSEIFASVKTYTGFTFDEDNENNIKSGTILADNSLVLKLYYSRNTYTITWLDEDGKELEKDESVYYGATPSFDSAAPTKESTTENTFSFIGFRKENETEVTNLELVTQNMTYIAVFIANVRSYVVNITAADSFGYVNTNIVPNVPYGTVLSVTNNIINVNNTIVIASSKNKDAQFTYLFDSFSINDGYVVTGDTNIQANFKAVTNTYTINLAVNNDRFGSISNNQVLNVPYGTKILINENTLVITDTTIIATPMQENEQYIYSFDSFSVVNEYEITSNTTVTANFTRVVKNYTVTFNVDDVNLGTVSKDYVSVPYGTQISINENKITFNTETQIVVTADTKTISGYTITFKNFGITDGVVTKDIVITANFECVKNKYKVQLNVGTGIVSVTGAGTYEFGQTVTISATVDVGYAWNMWNGSFEEISQTYSFVMPATNIALTANAVVNTGIKYIVEHYQEDLTGDYELKDVENLLGETNSLVTASAKTYIGFTFDEDNESNVKSGTVLGNGSLVLKLYYNRNRFTITWKNENGTVLKTDENIPYGQTPSYTGETLTKEATLQYSYTFAGWTPEIEVVTEDAEYTAVFTSAINKYTITITYMLKDEILKEETKIVDYNEDYTIYTYDKNYVVDKVTLNNEKVNDNNSVVLENISSDNNVVIYYKEIEKINPIILISIIGGVVLLVNIIGLSVIFKHKKKRGLIEKSNALIMNKNMQNQSANQNINEVKKIDTTKPQTKKEMDSTISITKPINLPTKKVVSPIKTPIKPNANTKAPIKPNIKPKN